MVAQFAFAVFLIIGTVVIQKQFMFMMEKDVGLQNEGIIDVNIPYEEMEKLTAFKDGLSKYPFNSKQGAQSVKYDGHEYHIGGD